MSHEHEFSDGSFDDTNRATQQACANEKDRRVNKATQDWPLCKGAQCADDATSNATNHTANDGHDHNQG